jgi:hypothetical protein
MLITVIGKKMKKKIFDSLPIDSPSWLIEFVIVYQSLNTDNLELLATIYHSNVTFIDPLHRVEGFVDLYKYFNNLYANLNSCEFVINKVIFDGNEAAIYWTMTYQHKKLNKGDLVTVLGTSNIKGEEDKVIFHRDYLDLGAMLYEQLPLFGKLTKWIKAKATS